MSKVYTVAILGVGGRGGEAYGSEFIKRPDKYKVVALCDFSEAKLEKYGERFGVEKALRFTDEGEFFKEKRADVLAVCTLDKDHVRHAVAGLKLGYDLLLEKPVSDSREECEELLAAQAKYGGRVCVCHVLRYAPAFVKVGELLDEGRIGRLVTVESLEQVAYFHQAHSYVRGNWRRAEETTPMILAKCCHDLDLMQYYAGAKCLSVSSVGDLTYFTKENAPDGATARCLDCPHKNGCPYSAKRIYIDRWFEQGKPENTWPQNVITTAYPLTEEAIYEAIENGPYGRCVFACDNDVVDHQITQMRFENGVTATLTMTAFTYGGGRETRLHGTLGEILLSEERNLIEVRTFGGEVERIDLADLTEGGYGHGGGDSKLVETLYDILEGNATERTSLAASIESHLMGIAAEESRKAGGNLVKIHKE